MTSAVVHYRIDGPPDAPPLVLAGSLGSDLTVWDPVVRALGPAFRVIRYDHRGHGASPPAAGSTSMADLGADAIALLDHLGLETVDFCGTSLGGMVALWLGVHAPHRVRRLAVLSSSAKLGPRDAWLDRARLVRQSGTKAVAEPVVERWFTPGFARREPTTVARMVAMVANADPESYAACCEAIASWDITEQLSQIAAPLLLVSGDDDLAIPPAHSYAIAAKVPHARVVILAQAAHLACVEQATRVAELSMTHFGTGAAAGHSSDAERARRGEAIRRAVLGDAHVDGARENTTELTAPFQDYITRSAWGDIWDRPGLSRAERSIVTLAALAALQHEHELEMHVAAALRNGLTVEQIREILLHLGVYAGVPVANRALSAAERVLRTPLISHRASKGNDS